MRPSPHVLVRAFAVLALAALAMGACRSGNNDDSGAPETEPPTASPEVQAAGDFQLAGTVDHAFQGIGPPVEVSLAGVSLSPSPDVAATASPAAAATASPTTGAPTQQGVFRVTLDNVSTELRDKCGASAGDKVNVFWLTDTQFDTALLTATTLEGSLEGRRVGVAGSIFVTGGQDQQDFALPSPTVAPTVSPAGTPGTLNTNCTLVADRVTTATEGTALPTVRPRARTRATARPTVAPTRTPIRTTAPPVTTAPPTATPTPVPSPTTTA